MMTRVFEEDVIKPVYIQLEEGDGSRLEGNGIVLTQTSFDIPSGNVIFAIITKFDTEKQEWEEAVNPF